MPQHRNRMRLILETPALQAHSALRYAEWRAVISEYVAGGSGNPADAPLPRPSVTQPRPGPGLVRALAGPPRLRLTAVLAESMTDLKAYVGASR